MLYETSEYIRNIPFYVGCTAQEAPKMLGLITKCRRPSGLAPTASCFSPGGFFGGAGAPRSSVSQPHHWCGAGHCLTVAMAVLGQFRRFGVFMWFPLISWWSRCRVHSSRGLSWAKTDYIIMYIHVYMYIYIYKPIYIWWCVYVYR
jgi:hypothetical protein